MTASPFSFPPGLPADPTLLATLLDLLPMGVMYYTPVVDTAGTLTDLTLAYLNPAAQRMTQLPARPGTTYRQQFPTTDENGAWDFHRRSWLGQEPQQFQFYYAADGFDSYFRVTAQRLGEGLLTIFTDTRDETRSEVEKALRESQAREQAARAEAEADRQRLHQVLMRLPASLALLRGPEHVYELVNPMYAQLFAKRSLPGHPLRAALPDLEGQGLYERFDRVYATGEPFYEPESETWADYTNTGKRERRYYRVALEPIRNAQGEVAEVLSFALDVTAQVEARHEREAQHQLLATVFESAPAAIWVAQGPAQVFEFVNPLMAQLLGQPVPQLLGRPYFEVLPELRSQGVPDLLRRVYEQGESIYQEELAFHLAHYAPGQVGYFTFVFQPLRDAHGQVTRVCCVALDVTTQVVARRQVEQLNQELEVRVAERTQELVQQQHLLDQILRQVPAAVATFAEPTHYFTFFNDRYQQLVAGRAQVGLSAAEALPDVAAQGYIALLDNLYATGQPYQGHESLVELPNQFTGQAEQHYFDSLYQPLLDAQGQPQGILVFAIEVTEQVLARRQAAALQAAALATAQTQAQARAVLYQVFEASPALICILRGPEHRYEYFNAAYQHQFSRELAGRSVAEVFPEAASQGFLTLLDRVYQTGETYFGTELPLYLEQPDEPASAPAYFTFTYQAYQEHGQTVGISVFAYDVTEQVLGRREREVARQRLERLFMDAPAGICILSGPTFVFELLNPVYQQLVPQRLLLGRPLLEAVPELAASPIPALLRQVYETGENYLEREIPVAIAQTTGGEVEVRHFTFVYQARRDEQGQVDGVLVFVSEVTEQVRARQQVQELNEELAAINEELTATNEELYESNRQLTRTNVDLDTFVYTASHDLKAPITNIESIMLALRDTLPPAVQQDTMISHLLDLLEQTTARFQFTIAQLTDLSKLQLAHAGPAEPVHLAAVIESVRLDLAPAIVAGEVQLTVEVAPELLVSFSPANLRSAFYNLLSNAVKYRDPARPAQVRVRAFAAGPRVVLEVQDNGLGLSAHQQQRLFGLFQRLHTHVEGTGVGLYITKRLVENGGGTIAVASQVAVGTTFTLTLPA